MLIRDTRCGLEVARSASVTSVTYEYRVGSTPDVQAYAIAQSPDPKDVC
ncbi:MAG: hypothetical protein AAFR15_01955 [Cyanobacteria bacterium J06627_15]